MARPYTIAVDVDGVLASYDHWRGYTYFGEPIAKVVDELKRLKKEIPDLKIIIHTARVTDKDTKELRPEAIAALEAWLDQNAISYDEIWISPGKPACQEYIDDRAVRVDVNPYGTSKPLFKVR